MMKCVYKYGSFVCLPLIPNVCNQTFLIFLVRHEIETWYRVSLKNVWIGNSVLNSFIGIHKDLQIHYSVWSLNVWIVF